MKSLPQKLLIACSLGCLALTTGEAGPAGPACEPISQVLHTQDSGIRTARLEVIESEGRWCELWAEVYGTGATAPPCDTTRVDFNSEVAVVAAGGEQSDDCHDIQVACVERTGRSGNLGVHVVRIEPSGSCLCDFFVVTPLDVVKVQRPFRRARFELTTFVDPCR